MNRRETLGMLGVGLFGAPAFRAPAQARPVQTSIDPQSPAGVALIYRKLAWIAGEGFGIWWLKGRRFCAVPPTYIPFWDMLIGTLFTVRNVDAETYAVTTLTTTFYTDIGTGAWLETFHNPVTGKDARVAYQPLRAAEQRFGPHGPIGEPAMTIPGTVATRSAEPGPAGIEGDDVWVRSDYAVRAVPDDATRRPFQVEDLSTYFGSLKDVANPAAEAIPAAQVFTDLLNFPGWLEMGDRNGHFFSRCFGRKVFHTAAMPREWQRLMAEHHPDVLADPLAALRG